MRNFMWLFATIAISVAFVGCGGGGTTPMKSGSVNLFVTDSFDTEYQQVMVTLYQIDVGRQGDPSSFRVVYSENSGLTLDVRTLANLAQFIGAGTLPEGVYNRARITLGTQLTVVNFAGQSSTVSFDTGHGTPIDNNRIQFEFPIQLTVAVGGTSTLIVDFDLPSFQMVNGMVRPALRHLRDDELDNRPRYAEIKGTVVAIDTGGFTLQMRNGRTVTVLTTPQTVIYSEEGRSATLAVGNKV